jgi:hypothetical protein
VRAVAVALIRQDQSNIIRLDKRYGIHRQILAKVTKKSKHDIVGTTSVVTPAIQQDRTGANHKNPMTTKVVTTKKITANGFTSLYPNTPA